MTGQGRLHFRPWLYKWSQPRPSTLQDRGCTNRSQPRPSTLKALGSTNRSQPRPSTLQDWGTNKSQRRPSTLQNPGCTNRSQPRQGLLQLQAWVTTKWSPINSFFSSLILIFHQYSVSRMHFYPTILQDSIRRHPGLEL